MEYTRRSVSCHFSWLIVLFLCSFVIGGNVQAGENGPPDQTVEEYMTRLNLNRKDAYRWYVKSLLTPEGFVLAATRCDEALEEFPDDRDFRWEILGLKEFALFDAGLFTEAEEALRLWHSEFKDDDTIHRDGQNRGDYMEYLLQLLLARIRKAQVRLDEAAEHYENAVALLTEEYLSRGSASYKGSSLVAKNVVLPMEIGDCYREDGRYRLAEAQYQAALKYAESKSNFSFQTTEEEKIRLEKQRTWYVEQCVQKISLCREKRSNQDLTDHD